MKRHLALGMLIAMAVSASAQKANEPVSWADRWVSASISIAKTAWERVQKEGRPLADRMVKAAPDYYKGAQNSLQSFVKKINETGIPQTFNEKQRLALELWNLRGAINVMSLADPQILKMLLKIEPGTIEKMQKMLQQTEVKLKKANLPGF